ncbi:YqaA family protein [Desulfogranum marinum]|uniref:YqaA family protein n=1 Tax=Desulfogranum marinum TaxID=453220 RepID=UPI0019647C38|nr:YqaA family protein [Desulfogranum marinum]MBM9514516.1 DedA family protein [Desulfogranum marinum]
MAEVVVANGYLFLFLLSFLAATVVPVGSEWLLVALLYSSLDPAGLLASATIGNVLGACTTYAVGVYGGPFLVEKVLRINSQTREKAAIQYRKYGTWSLLLSWVPIIGDPLCLAGGIFKTPLAWFVSLVLAGKLGRYAFIEYITLQAMG